MKTHTRKHPPQILVSRCYSETTPESAEAGENSDSGFVSEREGLTFRELVDLIRFDGFHGEGQTDWLTTGWSPPDMHDMTEREETLHFHRDNPPRLRKWWNLAICTAERMERERLNRNRRAV